MSKTQIFVESSKRSNGTSSNFQLEIAPILPPTSKLELLWAVIPLSTFNIPTGRNTFQWREGGPGSPNIRTAAVAPGNYNITEFITAVEAAMLAASSTASVYTVTYDSKTYKFTISRAAVFSMLFQDPIYSNWAELFGFLREESVNAVSVTSTTSSVLAQPQLVNIVIQEASTVVFTGLSGITRSSYLVPLKEGPDSVNYIIPEQPMSIEFPGPRTLTSLNISLQDTNSNLLDVNGANWSMMLIAHSEQKY